MWAGTPTTVELGGTSDEDNGASADARVCADGDVAEDVGVVADEDAVAEGGVALAVSFAGAAERDSLIERDVAAHDGGFADDDAGSVVDKEAAAKQRAGMDVDAGEKRANCESMRAGRRSFMRHSRWETRWIPDGPQARIAERGLRAWSARRGRAPALSEYLRGCGRTWAVAFHCLARCRRNVSVRAYQRIRDLRGQGQRFLAKRIEQDAGQVALAEAGQDDDDQLAGVLRARGYLERGTTAAPEQMPTKRPSSSGRRRAMAMRLVVGDLDDFVDELGVEDAGDESRAEALNLVRAGLAAGEHRAVRRLHGDGLELGLARLDVAGDAGDGAAGADAGDEDVDLAVGVFPDFRAGGAEVNGGVGGVVELLEDLAVGRLRQDLLGLGDGALHAVGAGREHELGARMPAAARGARGSSSRAW